ncbi:MAG: TRAP transporter substrate-binding protein DctP, partial [Eubacteriales bacterium]|nr:TRAP transporter substrate-binding protein DctP [Eubacteriales bacterium]
MKKYLSIILIIVLVLSMISMTGCGKEKEAGKNEDAIKLIYTHYQPGTPNQPKQAAALAFEAYVEKATNGAIDVEIYPNSELGDGPTVLEAMQNNTIQMTVVHDGPCSALWAPMGVFNMPFLFNSHAEAWTIYDGEYAKKLGEGLLENTGIRMLGLADNGVRHLTNSKRPIEKLEDA